MLFFEHIPETPAPVQTKTESLRTNQAFRTLPGNKNGGAMPGAGQCQLSFTDIDYTIDHGYEDVALERGRKRKVGLFEKVCR